MSDIKIGSVWHSEGNSFIDAEVIAVCRDEVWAQYIDGNDGEVYVSKWTVGDFLNQFEPTPDEERVFYSEPKAVQILNEAVQVMAERGKSYDKSGGEAERSMPKIVAMFNALTGHELTPEQGWKFMCCLKLARSEQGEYREDNYLDGAAYMALAGEEAEASSE